MRFLYVNRILSCSADSIVGEKTFDVGEPLRSSSTWSRKGLDGFSQDCCVIAPGATSEAIGQLASWCALRSNNFSGRPVFMFADRIEFFHEVRVGEKVLLDARIEKLEGSSFVFSGSAEGPAGIICRIESCHCHLAPLEEMENPDVTKLRFDQLISGGEEYGSGAEFAVAEALSAATYDRALGRLTADVRFHADSFFYQDHFPRRPVTPIIMINEAIGSLTRLVCDASISEYGRLLPRQVEGLKIRDFVMPNEAFHLEINLRERSSRSDGTFLLSTVAQASKSGRPILRGQYSYEWRRG